AGAVVSSSVVDFVPLGVGVDAEMVVMRGVEDRLICRVDAGHAADDVGRYVSANAALDVAFESDGELDGFEAAMTGFVDGSIEVAEARGGEEMLGDVVLYPRGRLHSRSGIALQVALLNSL